MLATILICAILIGIDQLIKYFVVQYLMPVVSAPLIPGIVELYYIENTGAAFSLFTGRQTFLIVVTAAALIVAAYVLLSRRLSDRLENIAVIMMFSGGVGNLIDRIANGYVIDYINLQFMNFAVFNFADMLVTVGFAVLVFAEIRIELQRSREKKDQESKERESQPLEAKPQTADENTTPKAMPEDAPKQDDKS